MEIPKSQFYLFWVEEPLISHHGYTFFQTYEEALQEACRSVESSEFIDLFPDNEHQIKLFFPNKNRKITIHSTLFTYDPKLPLAIPDYFAKEKTYDFKNINV